VIAMMWSDNGSWGGGGWWLFGGIFMLFCMWMMFRMMSHGGRHGSHGHHGFDTGYQRERGSGRPEQILAERFARGEIDVEEYDRRLGVLRQGSDGADAAT
jgi:putative membrane protein